MKGRGRLPRGGELCAVALGSSPKAASAPEQSYNRHEHHDRLHLTGDF